MLTINGFWNNDRMKLRLYRIMSEVEDLLLNRVQAVQFETARWKSWASVAFSHTHYDVATAKVMKVVSESTKSMEDT